MRIAGIVLDLYDDPKGVVLRNKLASTGQQLPDKLAETEILGADDLERLPDRLFALVADNDQTVVRKFAMHDAEHLVLSMIYFDETGHLLPQDVQQKIAANLINGCSWYGMDPPESLVKCALVGKALTALTVGLGAKDMADTARVGAQQSRERMESFRQAQAAGTKVASGREIQLSPAQDAALQRGEGPDTGHIWDPLSQFSNHDATHRKLDDQLKKLDQPEPAIGRGKKADLTGTEAMPQATLRSSVKPKRLDLPGKTAAAQMAVEEILEGWVHGGDLTHAQAPTLTKKAAYAHFALPHLQRYPLDNEDLVTKAAAYFDEYLYELPLPERRVFAQMVVSRGEELGVKTAGRVLDYSGEDYGANLVPELFARIHQFEGTGHEAVYEVLLEKRSELSPMIMAEMLREADEATGAADAYGQPGVGLLDPYMTVYGNKIAEEDEHYSWSEGGDYVSGMQLQSLTKHRSLLNGLFGDGFADEFQKDPIGIFKSMPSPQKVVLSRLAGDSNASTLRT